MLLLATMAFGQAKEDAGDGKMLDKQKSYIYITENTNALQNKEFATNYAD